MMPTIPGLPGNSAEEEQGQVLGRTADGSRLDIEAAKERCRAAAPGPWTPATILHLARKDDVEFAAHARSDLPAALEALEEARGERLTDDIATLREMAHDFYEGGRITVEQLNAFCAVGPIPEEE